MLIYKISFKKIKMSELVG